jgi:hypothetical protein
MKKILYIALLLLPFLSFGQGIPVSPTGPKANTFYFDTNTGKFVGYLGNNNWWWPLQYPDTVSTLATQYYVAHHSSGGTTTNTLTVNNSGSGDASSFTFNGSVAHTISYNSIGAQPTLVSGTNIKTVGGISLLGSGDIPFGNTIYTGDGRLTGFRQLDLAGQELDLGTNNTGVDISDGTPGQISMYTNNGSFGASVTINSTAGTADMFGHTGSTQAGNIEAGATASFILFRNASNLTQILTLQATGGALFNDGINGLGIKYNSNYTTNQRLQRLSIPSVNTVIALADSVKGTISGGTYIQNQYSALQASSNFWVNKGKFDDGSNDKFTIDPGSGAGFLAQNSVNALSELTTADLGDGLEYGLSGISPTTANTWFLNSNALSLAYATTSHPFQVQLDSALLITSNVGVNYSVKLSPFKLTIPTDFSITVGGSGGNIKIGLVSGDRIKFPSVTSGTIVSGYGVDASGNMVTYTPSGGGGTVTAVSIVPANGFAGTIATATTTPAITLTTSITGIIKGNGTAISAATAGTDYVQPIVWTAPKTSPYTAVVNDGVATDATSGTIAITLPTAPATGSLIWVKQVAGTNTTTVATGGSDVFNVSGGLTSITLPGLNSAVQLEYKSGIWYAYSVSNSLAFYDARYSPIAGSSSLNTLGTVTTGTWNASVINPTYGGTGVNNGSFTSTLTGNFATSGAFPLTLTQTASTNVTLPTTGILATRAGTEVFTNKDLTSGTNTFPTFNQNTTGTASNVTGIVAIANGGTGTSSPGLVAGTNITITGSWPNQTINASGGGGGGTVTTFSVVTANGVSASVANPTTTPAATFTLGAITPTTVNGNTLTTGTYTLTGTAGKTLTFNNSLTLAGTDATTMTFPSTSATIARTDAANSFSGVQTYTGGILNSGNITAASWGNATAASVVGIAYSSGPSSYTDNSTAAGTTIGNIFTTTFGKPTITASNATSGSKVTYTIGANVYIDGAPIAGTNTLLTAAYALEVNGPVFVNGTVTASVVGGLSTNSAANSSNFSSNGTTGNGLGASTNTAALLFGASANVQVRAQASGSSTSTATASASYVNFEVGKSPFTATATGTMTDMAQFVANSFGTITNASAITINNSYIGYFGNASSAATNNYVQWNGTGLFHIDGLTASQVVETDANKNLTSVAATTFVGSPNGTINILASTQTTLVAGTKALSITGVTTGSHAYVNAVSQGGTVSTTFEYAVVCTSGTVTITALTTGNVTNNLDTSTVNVMVTN